MNAFTASFVLCCCTGIANAQQGGYGFLGSDCGGAQIQAVGVPRIGQRFVVEVAADTSLVDGPFSYLLTGFGLLPQPIDIGALSGHQPCGPVAAFCGVLYTTVEDQQRALGAPNAAGLVGIGFQIPNDLGLIGVAFFQQNITVGSGFGTRCVDLSRAGLGVIGI